MPLKKTNDDWLKRQQRLHVSDIAEDFVSVTNNQGLRVAAHPSGKGQMRRWMRTQTNMPNLALLHPQFCRTEKLSRILELKSASISTEVFINVSKYIISCSYVHS